MLSVRLMQLIPFHGRLSSRAVQAPWSEPADYNVLYILKT